MILTILLLTLFSLIGVLGYLVYDLNKQYQKSQLTLNHYLRELAKLEALYELKVAYSVDDELTDY
jgi:hypothetical protein